MGTVRTSTYDAHEACRKYEETYAALSEEWTERLPITGNTKDAREEREARDAALRTDHSRRLRAAIVERDEALAAEGLMVDEGWREHDFVKDIVPLAPRPLDC